MIHSINVIGMYRRAGDVLLPAADIPDGKDVFVVCKITIDGYKNANPWGLPRLMNGHYKSYSERTIATDGVAIYGTRMWNGSFEITEDVILDDGVVARVFETVKDWFD